MINVKLDENYEYICEGEIELGFLGSYNSEMIELSGNYSSYELEKMSSKEINEECEILTKKYNDLISNINKNIDKIKNQFILWLFQDLTDSYFEFWECEDSGFPSFIIQDKMPDIVNEETMYFRISGDNYDRVCDEVFNKPADSLVGGEVFKEYLPMIDIEKLLSTIIPSFLKLSEYSVEFEINSDECDGNFLLATIGDIYNNLELDIIDNRG